MQPFFISLQVKNLPRFALYIQLKAMFCIVPFLQIVLKILQLILKFFDFFTLVLVLPLELGYSIG